MNDLHPSGIASFFMASKMMDINPVRLESIIENIAHNKLTKDDIKKRELDIITALNFDIETPNILYVLEVLIRKMGIMDNLKEENKGIFSEIVIYFAQLVLYDYKFISENNFSLIAGGIIVLVLKLMERVNLCINIKSYVQNKF